MVAAHLRETSPASDRYNCIAWAAEDMGRWWWPDSVKTSYWPESVPRDLTLSSFISAFQTLGYEVCSNGNLETGYLKIVLFCDDNDTPTHAARQLPNGFWTSKLGGYLDIEHDLDDFLSLPRIVSEYGYVKVFMRKKLEA